MNAKSPLQALPFIGFGRFVVTDSIALMGFTIFHRRDLAKARRALTRTRSELGYPGTMRFDGATVFGEGAPAVPDDKRRALDRLVDTLNTIPGMIRYTFLPLANYPDPLDGSEAGLRARAAISGVLTQAVFAVPDGGTHGPQAHECEVVSVDAADRESYAQGVLLDLADLLATAAAHREVDGDGSWLAPALLRIRYWSNQEIRARLEAKPEAQTA